MQHVCPRLFLSRPLSGLGRGLAIFVGLLAGAFIAPLPVRAAPMETVATSAILIDADTGSILFEKNAEDLMSPASMSKLMTVELAFKKLKDGSLTLEDTFHVSKKAWKMAGSKMWVLVESKIRVEDLLRGIIVQSGNDACIVVAEGLSGSEEAFAQAMTARAREIGLQKSTFTNATGWPDPGHKMTALELALLTRHLIREYPDYYRFFAEEEFTWSNITQPNRNPLLFLGVNADGLKTGHTEESGYGLVGSAARNGQRLILVVNGLSSERQRASESKRLLNWGFREFKTYPLLKVGQVVDEAEVWAGEYRRVPLVVPEDITVVLRRGARKDMKVSVSYDGPIRAPVRVGQTVGVLRVTAPGARTIEVPVLAGANVESLGLWGRTTSVLGHFLWGG